MLFVLFLVTFVLLLLYIKLKYYTLHGPLPGLPPQFFFGNLIQSGLLGSGASFHQVSLTFKKRFGNVFQFWLGSTRIVVVSGANDVEHIFNHRKIYDHGGVIVDTVSVLIKNSMIVLNGVKYKRHYALTSPLFRRGNIISFSDIFIDRTDKLLAQWRDSSPDHIHINILQKCENLMIDTFGFIAFEYDLKTLDSGNATASSEFTQALHICLHAFEIITYLPRMLSIIYLRFSPRHQRAHAIIAKYLDDVINRELVIDSESMSQRKRTSFIASLVNSLQKDEEAEAKKSEEEKQGLSRNEILDEMFAFMIVGYETTSTTLAWFIHLMSKYPRVQQKIKAELMIDDTKQDLTIDQLNSLTYLNCVINEVLRFCPPFNGTLRRMTADDRLPESGMELSKGTQVFIPFCNLARDPDLWSVDPNIFYPDRFLNEDKNHHPYALIPFGGGHRQCVAQELARFELKMMTARLMQHVTFGDGGSQLNSGGILSGVTDKPRNIGVTIKFDS